MFYMPFHASRQELTLENRKLIFPQYRNALQHSCFSKEKAPYLSLETPSGVVASFLEALKKDEEESALNYLSQSVVAIADIEGMQKLFNAKNKVHFFSHNEISEVQTVSLACDREDETEVISLKMLAEPNAFGKWKIYSIEKE